MQHLQSILTRHVEASGGRAALLKNHENSKHQAPKKSQRPNSNSSSDVGDLELEHWSFSGVWSLLFDVWLVGFGVLPTRQYE